MKPVRNVIHVLACALLALLLSFPIQADGNTPNVMTYQGYLVDSSGDPLGQDAPKNYDVVFRIYGHATQNDLRWSEQQTVTVDKGYFSTLLGDGSAFGSEPRPQLFQVFSGADVSERYVGITIKGVGPNGTDADILPRLRMLSSPFSYLAQNAIQANKLVNSAAGEVVTVSGPNVGINKSSPGTALDVVGDVSASGNLTLFGNSKFTLAGGITGAPYMKGGWTDNNHSSLEFHTFGAGIDRTALTIQPSGNVGVGTTAPVSKLHVYDTGLTGWKGMSTFGNEANATIAGAYNNVPIVGAHTLANGAFTSWAPLYVNTVSGTDGAHVVMARLGIGTTGTPTAHLDVAGPVKSRSGGFYLADTDGSDRAVLGLESANPTDPTIGIWNGGWHFVVKRNARVGMGTLAPRSQLEVVNPNPGTWSALVAKGYDGSDVVVMGTLAGKATIGGHNAAMTTFTDLLINPDAGRVGIGTRTPSAPLHVAGSAQYTTNLFAYLENQGAIGYNYDWPNTTSSFSILAANHIGAQRFDVLSDARIKKNIVEVKSSDALEVINALKVKDYNYVDAPLRGLQTQRGFIAQEVEKVLPGAVNRSEEFVPTIFTLADSSDYSEPSKTLTINLKKNHDLQVGDLVSLVSKENKFESKVLAVPSNTSFVVKSESNHEKLFVVGKKVNDFRTIDYDQLFSTGIAAIQELTAQVENLKKSEARIAELEAKAARADELESKLARLEKLVAKLSETKEASPATASFTPPGTKAATVAFSTSK